MRRRGPAIVVLLVAAVGVSGAIAVTLGTPTFAKRKLLAAVRDGCDGCTFDVDRVLVNLASGVVVAEGVHYHSNPNDFVEVSFDIDRLEGPLAHRPLLHSTWVFAHIAVSEPVFRVIEKDPKPTTTPSPETFPLNLPPLMVAAVSVSDGSFTYVHRVQGRDAVIRVSHVEGTANNFSSRPGLGSSHTTFDVSSQLERSANVQLHADFDLLAAKNDDHLQIGLQHLALRDMDPYFFKNDGVRVDGVLETAKTTMAIRSGKLTGDLSARYRDLVVHYSKTEDRGAINAFFSESLQKILIQKTQGQQAAAHFHVARARDESTINFILSGLKPAVHDILTKSNSHGQ